MPYCSIWGGLRRCAALRSLRTDGAVIEIPPASVASAALNIFSEKAS